MTAISVAAWLAAGVPSAMLLWFALEVAFGLPRRGRPAPAEPRGSFVVIVPAHDESLGIENTLSALREHVDPARILVVADNCSDDTAARARAAAVRVIERDDPERPGKGYALAFARDDLAAAPPKAIVIFDADCRLVSGSLDAIAARAIREGTAVQGENIQTTGAEPTPMVSLGAFAFYMMNIVRARGLERLGGGTFLQGTGMAMPWPVFSRLSLASGNAVEDADLTLQLARMEVPVRFDSGCRVESPAGSQDAHLEQRRRWEVGFVRLGLDQGLPAVLRGVAAMSRLRCAIGAHFLVPPFALLLLVGCVSCLGLLVAGRLVGAGPAALVGTSLLLAAGAVVIAWLLIGRKIVDGATLLAAPRYVIWKLPIYASLTRRGPVEWTRTRRGTTEESTSPTSRHP